MKRTVKDVIAELEKLDPNEIVFGFIYTKEDVKALEEYNPVTQQIIQPYDDELAEAVLSNLDGYDVIFECIHNCMHSEVSYQVDQLSKKENVQVESPSY